MWTTWSRRLNCELRILMKTFKLLANSSYYILINSALSDFVIPLISSPICENILFSISSLVFSLPLLSTLWRNIFYCLSRLNVFWEKIKKWVNEWWKWKWKRVLIERQWEILHTNHVLNLIYAKSQKWWGKIKHNKSLTAYIARRLRQLKIRRGNEFMQRRISAAAMEINGFCFVCEWRQ